MKIDFCRWGRHHTRTRSWLTKLLAIVQHTKIRYDKDDRKYDTLLLAISKWITFKCFKWNVCVCACLFVWTLFFLFWMLSMLFTELWLFLIYYREEMLQPKRNTHAFFYAWSLYECLCMCIRVFQQKKNYVSKRRAL